MRSEAREGLSQGDRGHTTELFSGGPGLEGWSAVSFRVSDCVLFVHLLPTRVNSKQGEQAFTFEACGHRRTSLSRGPKALTGAPLERLARLMDQRRAEPKRSRHPP